MSTLETHLSRCVCSSGAFNQARCSGVKLFSVIELGEYLSQCLWKWGSSISITPSSFFKSLIYLERLIRHSCSFFPHQQLSSHSRCYTHLYLGAAQHNHSRSLARLAVECLARRQLDYREKSSLFPNHFQAQYLNLKDLPWFYTRHFFSLCNLEAATTLRQLQHHLWEQLFDLDEFGSIADHYPDDDNGALKTAGVAIMGTQGQDISFSAPLWPFSLFFLFVGPPTL